MTIIGIDLGTTNSLAACYKDGQVQIIPNRLGGKLTPSIVSILDNEVIIGSTAKEIQAKNPQVSASAFKRFIGSAKEYKLGDVNLSAVDLSSFVLKSLVEDAKAFLGEPVDEAIISVPAYFNDIQRKATIEAALLAGIKVERVINEPTAAAVAYHMHDKSDETVLAIVDLGGGTFDVSILDIFDSIIEVRAVAGDNYLGGEDFDNIIVDYLIKEMKVDRGDLSIDILSQLKYAAEVAKKDLSIKPSTQIKIIHDNDEHIITFNEEIMEKLLGNQIERLREPLKKAILDSGFKVSQIDDVILVGGSTRMPIIKKFVAKLFGKLPLCHLNPDEVVARGAALTAAMKMRNKDLEDTVLTDVCPYTLGTAIQRYLPNGDNVIVFDPIIERNMTIPSSISKLYQNSADYQSHVSIKVYQGESRRIEENLNLGNIKFQIPKAEKGTVFIEVRFTYDINGILEVEVKEEINATYIKQIMINSNNLSDEEIEKKMLALEKLKMHPRDNEENKHLIAKGERLYEITLGELRERIDLETNMFLSIIERQDPDDIKRAKVRYREFITYVEEIL